MSFTPDYSLKVAPLRCPLRVLRRIVITYSVPISSAKVQQIFDMCKFFGEKMHKYAVKHKKEDPQKEDLLF